MHGETAEQALMRAATVAGWRAATDDAWGVPVTDLRPGDTLKAGGEWYTLTRVTDAGDLLLDDRGQSFFYAVSAGERFVVAEPAA